MHDTDTLRRLDLNLFKIFDAVYRERNITRAGEAVFLSQSAVSHALARLARHFDAPLFERHGRGVTPTALAERLAPEIRRALASLNRSVQLQHEFSPQRDIRRLRLALHVEQEPLVLPALVRALRAVVPAIHIDSVRLDRASAVSDLATGRLDLVVDVALPGRAELVHVPLVSDEMCVASARGSAVTAARYAAAEHVVVSSRRSGLALEDIALTSAGVQRRIALRCQNYDAACEVVAASELLLTLPRRNALQLRERHRIHVSRVPVALPAGGQHLYWHQQSDGDPANRWLRERVMEVFRAGVPARVRRRISR